MCLPNQVLSTAIGSNHKIKHWTNLKFLIWNHFYSTILEFSTQYCFDLFFCVPHFFSLHFIQLAFVLSSPLTSTIKAKPSNKPPAHFFFPYEVLPFQIEIFRVPRVFSINRYTTSCHFKLSPLLFQHSVMDFACVFVDVSLLNTSAASERNPKLEQYKVKAYILCAALPVSSSLFGYYFVLSSLPSLSSFGGCTNTLLMMMIEMPPENIQSWALLRLQNSQHDGHFATSWPTHSPAFHNNQGMQRGRSDGGSSRGLRCCLVQKRQKNLSHLNVFFRSVRFATLPTNVTPHRRR